MKTLNYVILLLIGCTLFLASCEDDSDTNLDEEATGISLNATSHTFTQEDETFQLIASPQPENSKLGAVIWLSTNEDIVSVSETGIVTPNNNGIASVTVIAMDSTLTSQCEFTVALPITSIEVIELSSSILTLVEIGSTTQIEASITPVDASITQLTWESSNETVATVDENGLVTAVANGVTTITATATDGSNVSATQEITVDTNAAVVSVTAVKFKLLNASLETGQLLQLDPVIFPQNATNKNVTYISSNESNVSVDSEGLVTTFAAGNGQATDIIVTTEDGNHRDTLAISVKNINAGPLNARGSFSDGNLVNVLITPASDTEVSIEFTPTSNSISTTNESVSSGIQLVKSDITLTGFTIGTELSATISNSNGTSMELRLHRNNVDDGFNLKGVWNVDGSAFPDGNVTYSFKFINP